MNDLVEQDPGLSYARVGLHRAEKTPSVEDPMSLYRTIAALGLCFMSGHALAQNYNCTVTSSGAGASTMSASVNGNAAFTGTFTGNYNATSNPGGTRVFNLILFGPRPPAPTNLTKNMHGTGTSTGTANGNPIGTYSLAVNLGANTVTLTSLSTNLVGPATPSTSPVSATVTADPFSTAVPDYNYPLFIPITVPLGTASLTSMQVTQTAPASGPLTPAGGGRYTFSLTVPADVTATLDFQGASNSQVSSQQLSVTGSVTPGPSSCTASLTISLNQSDSNTTPQPQPPTPFDLPAPSGVPTDPPAHLILTLTITSVGDTVTGSATLPATGVIPPPPCGSGDFDCDGDTGTDADIEAFFRCIAGNCPAAPCASTGDFNHDGDVATDADIEAFFRVLAGGNC
jgi:hypothetical protein